MADLTNEKLDELEALANAATPEPWVYRNEYGIEKVEAEGDDNDRGVAVANGEDESGEEHERGCRDMEFIAAARAAVPSLVAEVRRLRASPSPSPRDGLAERVAKFAADLKDAAGDGGWSLSAAVAKKIAEDLLGLLSPGETTADAAQQALPCGCVTCVCKTEDRCLRCGAHEAPACQASRLAGGPRHVAPAPAPAESAGKGP